MRTDILALGRFWFFGVMVLFGSFSNQVEAHSHGHAKESSFVGGFNQAWLHDNYGHQWMDAYYDPVEAERILQLTAKSGARVLRMWILEGLNNQGLIWSSDGQPAGIQPEVLKNIRSFSQLAAQSKIQIEWTLVTSDPWLDLSELNDPVFTELRRRWWNIFNDLYGSSDAMNEKVFTPLIQLLAEPEIAPTVFAIDIANEIDNRVVKQGFAQGWSSLNSYVCKTRDLIRSIHAFPVTASIGWPAVPGVNPAGAVGNVLGGNFNIDCVDQVDIHLYNDQGAIDSCSGLQALAKQVPIYLAEFGQLSGSYDNALQSQVTSSFINNAESCGLAGAFAWRLSDIRPGVNTEARLSYEAFGELRPAFGVLQSLFTGF